MNGRLATPLYRSPIWLPGGHLETIYSSLLFPTPEIAYRRERWDTPDGDFLDLDWIDARLPSALVVLFHGLEGSSRSHYATRVMAAVRAKHWHGVVPHFRGCSGELNRLPRAYHSGDFQEIDWILRRLKSAIGCRPLFAVGVSLGGNALLKWCGELGSAAHQVVAAAAAVSAPLDLQAAGDNLARGFNRVYTHNFLRTLKAKSAAKLERYPGLFDSERLWQSRTMREFDDVVTAPLHGFKNTEDYWTRASSKPVLKHVRIPTLVINARNDPFLPESALPKPAEVAADVRLIFPTTGGHVGFLSSPFPGRSIGSRKQYFRFLKNLSEFVNCANQGACPIPYTVYNYSYRG